MLELVIVLQIIAGTIMMVLSINALQRRSSPQVLSFSLVMACAAIWTFSFAAEIISPTLSGKLFWANVQFLGITFLPVTWLALTLYSLGQPRHTLRIVPALTIIPVVTNVVIWTNSYHHLFRKNPFIITTNVPFPILSNDYGPFFYGVHAPYGYFLSLISLILLIRSLWHSPTIYRRQRTVLTMGFSGPLVVDILYTFGITPIKDFNFTSVVFAISGLLLSGGVFYLRFLDILPLAYAAVINEMNVGVIVLDAWGRVSYINPEAEKITGMDLDKDIGIEAVQVFPPLKKLLNLGRDNFEIIVPVQGKKQVYQLRSSVIQRGRAGKVGLVVTLHDITERAKLHAQVEKMSITDALTGVLNRRGLTERGKLEIQRSHRYQRDLSLILIDVDNFKDINDKFGHQIGDTVLIKIVKIISERVRANDIVFRYGGDEFVVLLPETNSSKALETAERIRDGLTQITLAQITIDGGDLQEEKVSLSLGVTSLSSDDDLDTLLFRADQALYKAKSLGKDQTVLVSSPDY